MQYDHIDVIRKYYSYTKRGDRHKEIHYRLLKHNDPFVYQLIKKVEFEKDQCNEKNCNQAIAKK